MGFAAADQKAWETVFLPSAFKIHLSIKNKQKVGCPQTKISLQSNKKEWKYASFREKENLTKLGLPSKKRYV